MAHDNHAHATYNNSLSHFCYTYSTCTYTPSPVYEMVDMSTADSQNNMSTENQLHHRDHFAEVHEADTSKDQPHAACAESESTVQVELTLNPAGTAGSPGNPYTIQEGIREEGLYQPLIPMRPTEAAVSSSDYQSLTRFNTAAIDELDDSPPPLPPKPNKQ